MKKKTRYTFIALAIIALAVFLYLWLAEERPREEAPSEEPRRYAHQPVGFIPIRERTFDRTDEEGGINYLPQRFSIQEDPTTPGSPPFVGRALFPQGWIGGYEPMATQTEISEQGFTQLYVSFWLKVSENWQGHPVVNKIGYVWTHEKPVVAVVFIGEGQEPLHSEIRLQDIPAALPRHLLSNKGNKEMKIPIAPRGGVSISWDFQCCKYPLNYFPNPITASSGVFTTNQERTMAPLGNPPQRKYQQ